MLDIVKSSDAFRLLRLRFLRPPPSSFFVSSINPLPIPIELAIGVTDDYGSEISFFDSLKLSLSLLDSTTGLPYPNATLSFVDNSSPSDFTIHSSRGHFHSLKLVITFSGRGIKYFSLKFLLSVVPDNPKSILNLSNDSQAVLEFIGEERQMPLESWNGNSYIFMRVLSGEVEVATSGTKGKGSASTSKVQNAIRTLYMPTFTSPTSLLSLLYAIERPGLNNSTGSRIWDCGIALACFLSLYPSYLIPPNSSSSTSSPIRVVELGSGCGLAGQAALRILSNHKKVLSDFSVIETDIEATVTTTLQENLDANQLSIGSDSSRISAKVLDWGTLSIEETESFVGSASLDSYVTILGSDILYDPDTHHSLYLTILSLLGSPTSSSTRSTIETGRRKALIAYKARTDGDDGFFKMVKGDGRSAEKVWEWGEIQIWQIR